MSSFPLPETQSCISFLTTTIKALHLSLHHSHDDDDDVRLVPPPQHPPHAGVLTPPPTVTTIDQSQPSNARESRNPSSPRQHNMHQQMKYHPSLSAPGSVTARDPDTEVAGKMLNAFIQACDAAESVSASSPGLPSDIKSSADAHEPQPRLIRGA
ncbi:hypothetical protein V8E36_001689 [Tilletia maclaganii]